MHSIESRLLQDRERHRLLVHPGIFQLGNCTGWGSEGVTENCQGEIVTVLQVLSLT